MPPIKPNFSFSKISILKEVATKKATNQVITAKNKLDYETIQAIIHAYSGCIGYDHNQNKFFYK